MSENLKPFFGNDAVKTVKLTEWMEWASRKPGAPHNVVLPMIQRGSVWAPHKLLDLWDTLLRGMPVGALMASDAVGPVKGLEETRTHSSKAGDIGLIDGQQRTLAMLAGWPQLLENSWRPVAIWVDLTDKHQGEYRFRLWATTRAQPFGYSRASAGGQPLTKLERKKLRLANQAWDKMEAQLLWIQPDFMPWEAKFAIPLKELIESQLNKKSTLEAFVLERRASYAEALEGKVKKATDSQVTDKNSPEKENATKIELQKDIAKHFADKRTALPTEAELIERIPAIDAALNKVLACQFPIIHVPQESFEDNMIDVDDDKVNPDPPLAILFKRVGSSGVDLSNADYVYAVIKHHKSEVHDMVDDLLTDAKIRAIYTPTTLVMSAVRVTMLALNTDDDKGPKLTDSAKLDKATFARMVRNHSGFIKEFEKHIQPDGIFVTSLKQVLKNISYTTDDFTTGLPKHALCLVQIPLLEIILAWHALHKPSVETLKQSRLAMVRFVLQGNLCVLDYAKASEVAIKAIKLKVGTIAASETFPDQVLLNLLAEGDKPLAYRLPSPETLSAINDLTSSPNGTNGLRGWTRFVVANEANKQYVEIYKRWWMSRKGGGHIHPMLLWLQRDYIFATFEKVQALAGMDEETPFDFDHILPSAQWVCGTGNSGPETFMAFPLRDESRNILDKTGHWYVGNSIGNIHVLESSENRSWGDAPVREKLDKVGFPINALIDSQCDWRKASGNTENDREWNEVRALAFQKAVEKRAFAMYKKFYDDLRQE